MSKGFNAARCVVQLKLAVSRIALHRVKRKELNEISKKEVLNLIIEDKIEQAKAKIVHIIKDDYYIGVLNALEIHCEKLKTRVQVFQSQSSCPLDVKEAVCSIIYAAPYLYNSPELMMLRNMFIVKFGKSFVTESVTNNCITRKIFLGLSQDNPSEALVNYYFYMILQMSHKDGSFPDASNIDINDIPQNFEISTSIEDSSNIEFPDAPLDEGVNVSNSASNKISIEGMLILDNSKNYWVLPSKPQNDKPVYIPPTRLNNANPNDKVRVILDHRTDGQLSGRISEIINAPQTGSKSLSNTQQGQFRIDSQRHSWCLKDGYDPIFIPPHLRNGAYDGDQVTVEVHFAKDERKIGTVLTIDNSNRHQVQNIEDDMTLIGSIKIQDDGTGLFFNVSKPSPTPIIIRKEHTLGVLSGSKVMIKIIEKSIKNHEAKLYGKVIKNMGFAVDKARHSSSLLPFTGVMSWNHDGDAIITDIENELNKAIIPKDQIGTLSEGDKCKIGILSGETLHGYPVGYIIEIMKSTSLSDDLDYGFDTSHPIEGDELDFLAEIFDSMGSINQIRSLNSQDSILDDHFSPLLATELDPDNTWVIDFGSYSVKVGTANHSLPMHQIPTVFSENNFKDNRLLYMGKEPSQRLVGFDAMSMKSVFKLQYPFKQGRTHNREKITAIIKNIFDNINFDKKHDTILFTEAETHPKENQDFFSDILFRHFNVPYLGYIRNSTLSLMASFESTGIILDLGHTSTSITCIVDGYILSHASSSFDISGEDLTNYLRKLLIESGLIETEGYEKDVVNIKHTKMKISPKSLSNDLLDPYIPQEAPFTYALSDGREINISNEPLLASEILFHPSLIGKDIPGLHVFISQSIFKCDIDLRKPLLNHILCVGGTSLIPGLKIRLQYELEMLFPNVQVNVAIPNHSEYYPWIGGSLYGSSNDFQKIIKPRDRYIQKTK